jgi:single-strand DNA-binding protein
MIRNQVQIIGNVGRAPTLTAKTKDLKPVVCFAIAQDVNGMDEATQKLVKKDAQWFQVSCFAGLAERTLNSLQKGDLVVVSGELKSRAYQTSTGEKRTSTEIVANEVFRLERLIKSSAKDLEKDTSELDLCADFENFEGAEADL